MALLDIQAMGPARDAIAARDDDDSSTSVIFCDTGDIGIIDL